jgi:hypothetical protein
MCCATVADEEEINNTDMANAFHLSREWVQRVNGKTDLSEKDLLTIDSLVKALLPHSERKVRELRSKMSTSAIWLAFQQPPRPAMAKPGRQSCDA